MFLQLASSFFFSFSFCFIVLVLMCLNHDLYKISNFLWLIFLCKWSYILGIQVSFELLSGCSCGYKWYRHCYKVIQCKVTMIEELSIRNFWGLTWWHWRWIDCTNFRCWIQKHWIGKVCKFGRRFGLVQGARLYHSWTFISWSYLCTIS